MGDIFRTIDIWGLTESAKRLGHAADTQVLVIQGLPRASSRQGWPNACAESS